MSQSQWRCLKALKRYVDETFRTVELLTSFAQTVLEPYHYLESMPSKGVRNAAIDGLEAWYQVPEKSLETIRYIINTLHSSSLMSVAQVLKG